MFERFTHQAREVVNGSVKAAVELGHDHVDTEHILLSLLTVDSGIAYDVLREAGVDAQEVRAAMRRPDMDAEALESIGIDLDAVRARVEETFGPGALDEVPDERKPRWHKPFTPQSKKVLELSLREAIALKQNYIGTEHILLGLIREDDGMAAKILTAQGIDLAELRAKTIAKVKPGGGDHRA